MITLSFPDRDSRILAQAASATFKCAIEEYSEATQALSGLIVCYNFNSESVSNEIRTLAKNAYANQLFWCHAQDWTRDSLAPDIISYLAQYSTPAWEKRHVVNNMVNGEIVGDKPEIVELPALEGSEEDIYEKLQNLMEEKQQKEKDPSLRQLAEHLFRIDKEGPYHFHQARIRSMQMAASPVQSSRLF